MILCLSATIEKAVFTSLIESEEKLSADTTSRQMLEAELTDKKILSAGIKKDNEYGASVLETICKTQFEIYCPVNFHEFLYDEGSSVLWANGVLMQFG